MRFGSPAALMASNESMNAGLMIARSIAWNAPTNVRSSVVRRPGMIALA
jgi:hypothetical protein